MRLGPTRKSQTHNHVNHSQTSNGGAITNHSRPIPNLHTIPSAYFNVSKKMPRIVQQSQEFDITLDSDGEELDSQSGLLGSMLNSLIHEVLNCLISQRFEGETR